MTLKASIIMTGISIGLLVIYGADVAAGADAGEGFLGSDHKTRGYALGVPSVILPIIAFFISRKEPSQLLGILLIISGILILIGGVAGFSAEPSESEIAGAMLAMSGILVALGAFIIALGAKKLKKS